MQILFINQPTSEYGQSLLYHGLRQLGHFVQTLYPNTFNFNSLSDCNGDCQRQNAPCKVMGDIGCETHPSHLTLTPCILFGDILKHNWDLIVTNNGYGNESIHRHFRARDIPIAALDLGDAKISSWNAWCEVIGGQPDFFFRREFCIGQNGSPLSYSFYEEKSRQNNLAFPVWDVSCLYRPTNPQRAKFAREISKAFDNSVVGAKPHSEYLETISSSLFSVALPGAGEDTLRRWEIASQGSVLCKPASAGIVINNDFEGGISCIDFTDIDDLISQIKYYLNSYDGDVYNTLRNNCFNHYMKYHTTEKRAQEFLNICGF